MQMNELFGVLVSVSAEFKVSSITVQQRQLEGTSASCPELMTVEINPVDGRLCSYDGTNVIILITFQIPNWSTKAISYKPSAFKQIILCQNFDLSRTQWAIGKQDAIVKGPNEVIGLLTSVTTELA
jgi:hypothetical protein